MKEVTPVDAVELKNPNISARSVSILQELIRTPFTARSVKSAGRLFLIDFKRTETYRNVCKLVEVFHICL